MKLMFFRNTVNGLIAFLSFYRNLYIAEQKCRVRFLWNDKEYIKKYA
ncbi:DNA replication terminus site-binding protein [uncultured Chryseobacterium sp.]